MIRTLYLFTEQFPYGKTSETAFLQNEIKYFNDKFDEIIIVPENISESLNYVLNYKIDLSLHYAFLGGDKFVNKFSFITSKYFYFEIIEKGLFFWSIRRLKRLGSFINRAIIVKNWINKVIIKDKQRRKILFYSYWNTDITFGLTISKIKHFNNPIISRAHAHDLYENKCFFGYNPCLKKTISGLSQLFPVSQNGIDYLNHSFPSLIEKFTKMPLGVDKATKINCPSKDSIVRVVSCSYMIKRKRIDLIQKGLFYFTQKYHRRLFWTHFGDGDLFHKIKNASLILDNEYFHSDFKGFISNKEILEYYQNNPVDIFITTSESEGLPMTLMEAQAHGIPTIGTAVNGIPEIINSENGILLSPNPSPEEIADAVYKVISDYDKFLSMRKKSIDNWNKKFNQEVNYKNFADIISSFI